MKKRAKTPPDSGHKKTLHSWRVISDSVQVGRLELPSLAALVPDTSVSTNSTTPAIRAAKIKRRIIVEKEYFAKILGEYGERALMPHVPKCNPFSSPIPVRNLGYHSNTARYLILGHRMWNTE